MKDRLGWEKIRQCHVGLGLYFANKHFTSQVSRIIRLFWELGDFVSK